LLLVAFLLVNAPNCHLSLVLASVVQGDAVNCNNCQCRGCLWTGWFKQPHTADHNSSSLYH